MKTLSVREVASALGLTKRAVMYRLENGKLKGTRVTNNYGQEEWRVYPNKEIMQAVEAKTREPAGETALNFEPEDAESVEAESVTVDGVEQEKAPDGWHATEMDRLEIIAEKLMKPLAEKLEAQAMALREKDLIIAEQSRQLKLLPDLEKRAEEERKAAELRALESEALKKQIAAMQEQKEEAEKANQKVEELQKAMEQLRAEDAARLEQLKEEMEKLRTPWWKKMFQSQ